MKCYFLSIATAAATTTTTTAVCMPQETHSRPLHIDCVRRSLFRPFDSRVYFVIGLFHSFHYCLARATPLHRLSAINLCGQTWTFIFMEIFVVFHKQKIVPFFIWISIRMKWQLSLLLTSVSAPNVLSFRRMEFLLLSHFPSSAAHADTFSV